VNLSALAISRPVATTLLTLGLALAGAIAFFLLRVSPVPQIDYPSVQVSASMPGASPQDMASSVATPLEKHLGQIADVTEMSSSSSLGSTRISLEFGLDRSIDGAQRDVQAAINAARADLPFSLRTNPTYRYLNPAEVPVIILTLTSKTLSPGQLYNTAAVILQPKLAQVEGVGDVSIGGGALPAVRVELSPLALFKYGIGLEDVRAALAATNTNGPKGFIEDSERRFQIYTNSQATKASDYRDVLVAYRGGRAVHLADIATLADSVEDVRTTGMVNGQVAIQVQCTRQPGANMVQVADRIRALLPTLIASLPPDADLRVVQDRTLTIRASLADIERTLLITIGLVIVVVFAFLRDIRATLVSSVAVPVSLLATFAPMYLLNYSLDNLSLMALTIATGFIVDDAIVVVENVIHHMESGRPRLDAVLRGTRQVGFTVFAMSASLIAVFIPVLLMDGLVGRMLREFAITLSVSILISLGLSLTLTPMLCARWLRPPSSPQNHSALWRFSERGFTAMRDWYARTLQLALNHRRGTLLALVATIVLNGYLFAVVPKGFFPQQDTGRMRGNILADQSISFQAMRQKLSQYTQVLQSDPAILNAIGNIGGGQMNSADILVGLKPAAQRRVDVDQIIARLRRRIARVPGATLSLQPVQDIRSGVQVTGSQYQYVLQADTVDDLRIWSPRVAEAMRRLPELADVVSNLQDKGLQTELELDRATASRLHLSAAQIDNTLYDAFGQRQVSTIYSSLNQYHVVMEVQPRFWQSPEVLSQLFVSTAAATAAAVKGGASTGSPISNNAETMVPLASFAAFRANSTPLAVNHVGPFAATTISFNLAPGVSLGDAAAAIDRVIGKLGMPATLHGGFLGTAAAFQRSLANEPLLIACALMAVYIVLGILYESIIHPLTILSTLPSAGVGAVLALLVCRTDLSIIAMIGLLLLIGVVMKNAIMMIDYALVAERAGLPPAEAIYQAAVQRLRPILMTTMVALLGALPLALGSAEGSELRRPLGIAIVGGLLVSQVLTLYTVPVVYLYLGRIGAWFATRRQALSGRRLAPRGHWDSAI
jgi:multidrug efflux pump